MERRRRETEPSHEERSLDERIEERVRRGHVPVLVGATDDCTERVMVPVKLFNDPCISALLHMAGQELGYEHEGVLRIPCDAEHFRRLIELVSKPRS